MLDYVLQVVVFQLGFLLMYELLLKKETFFYDKQAVFISNTACFTFTAIIEN